MKKTDLVVKSNNLIQAGYTLSLVEQRLILLAIVEARETKLGISADAYLTVHASTYANQFGVTIGAAYVALSQAVDTLFERQVTFYDKDEKTGKVRRNKTRWVSKIGYVESAANVQLIFAPDIVPEITRLESNFTKYDLQQVAGLKSAYAVRLYELLIQWRPIGRTPVFSMQIFREQLGLHPDEYLRIHHLKARVLDLAVNQINTHTDLTVRYEQHKSGRKITGFSFEFKMLPRPEPEKTKRVQPDKAAAKRKTVDARSDYWDRLHGLELAECQKINPALCRADIETIAKALNISALQAMQQIRNQAKQKTNTLALES